MTIQDTFQDTKDQLGKPYHDLEFLLDALKETLTQNGEAEMAAQIPLVNPLALDSLAVTPRFLDFARIAGPASPRLTLVHGGEQTFASQGAMVRGWTAIADALGDSG